MISRSAERGYSQTDAGQHLLVGDPERPLLLRRGRATSARQFLAQARALAAALPGEGRLVNLCEDRGNFLLGFAAALLAGRCTLLPPSRAPQAVVQVARSHGPAALIHDTQVESAIAGVVAEGPFRPPWIEPERQVAIGFTSGSTGTPKASAKTWAAFLACTRSNGEAFRRIGRPRMNVLATVPSQHMYGMETCVLLPLLDEMAIAVERPLFPAELEQALAVLPAPRLLVTTPVHLRAFVAAGLDYPPVDLIVSATAPLPADLARAAEAAFRAPLLETFGSTETCIIASRRTAAETAWTPYPGLDLEPATDGTWLRARHYDSPVLLNDYIRTLEDGRFLVEGRSQDLIEIAGKRASLGDIGARMLSVAGVDDAAVLQAGERRGGVQRLVAFVVAPGVEDVRILDELRQWLDPVFLPRRLVRVPRLPRNETGKLCRADLLALLER